MLNISDKAKVKQDILKEIAKLEGVISLFWFQNTLCINVDEKEFKSYDILDQMVPNIKNILPEFALIIEKAEFLT